MTVGDETGSHRPQSLRRNFSWVLAGNGTLAACQWLALVFMAKLASPEMVGQYSLALAIAMPVIGGTNLQIRTLMSTDARREFTFREYFGARLATAVAGAVLVTGILAVTDYSPLVDAVVITLLISRTLDSLSDVPYGQLQQREQMTRIGISLVLHGLLQLAAFTATLAASGNLLLAVVAGGVASAALLLGYDLPGARHWNVSDGIRPTWSTAVLRRIAWLGLPLSLVTAVNALAGNVPRYFIAEHIGERELGIFAAMFYLTVAGSMVTGALSDPASPRLAKLAAAGDLGGFRRLLFRLVLIALGIAVTGLLVAIVAGERLLALVYRPEYATYGSAFIWLMAAAIPAHVASVLGIAMNALRRFHVQVPLPVVNLALTVLLAAFLIPSRGVTGAGQVVFAAAALSMITTAVLLSWCLRQAEHEGPAA